MEKLFVAYLVKDGNVVDRDGYDVLVKEIDDNKYQELITGEVFENYRCSNDDLSICLCYRIDPVLQYKLINRYLRFEANRVNTIISKCKIRKLTNN